MRILTTIACIVIAMGCFAQDMIVKKDGSIIQAKVAKISSSEVEYKKWSNQDGPLYAITKSEILAINYQNGEKETFEVAPEKEIPFSKSTPRLIERPIAKNNGELISQYNKNLTFKEEEKVGKKISSAVGSFAFSDNSVLSNDDVEIQFVVSSCTSPATTPLGSHYFTHNEHLLFRYSIIIKNKTNNIIYFDLANCTRSNNKTMESKSYYSGESVSVSHGSSTGIGGGGLATKIGLGVGIGSSSSHSATHTYTEDRIVSIPANGFKTIVDFKLTKIKSTKCELVTRGEELIFGHSRSAEEPIWGNYMFSKAGIPYGAIKKNEIIEYDYENSPLVLNYSFVYSQSSNFSNYSFISANLYLKKLIGLPCYWNYNGCTLWIKGWSKRPKAIDDYLDGYDDHTICAPIFLDE